MKKIVGTIIIIAFFSSCFHKYNNTPQQKKAYSLMSGQKPDTIIAYHGAWTGSMDLFIIQGKLTIPKQLPGNRSYAAVCDIKVCGNFPQDELDYTKIFHQPGFWYKITGKVIYPDSNNGVGYIPVFYVETFKKFKFDIPDWEGTDSFNDHPGRAKILDGVLENVMFEGQHLSSILHILGRPDFSDSAQITYNIEVKYGSDIDPVFIKNLSINFNKDSIITSKRLVEIKK